MTPARSLSVEERSRPKRGGSSLFRDGYALIARSGALCRHTTKQRDAALFGRGRSRLLAHIHGTVERSFKTIVRSECPFENESESKTHLK